MVADTLSCPTRVIAVAAVTPTDVTTPHVNLHIAQARGCPGERRGGRIGEKSVTLLLPKNRPVQHTLEI
jgi:hypothetical protein